MKSCEDGLPFALIAWIIKQRKEIEEHRQYMIRKNTQDDQEYSFFLFAVSQQWQHLQKFEQNLVMNYVAWKDDGRIFTHRQREVIGSMYLRVVLEKKPKV